MAADSERASDQFHVLATIFLFRQKVEHGPVMPDVARGQLRDPADVAHNPMDQIGRIPQSGFGVFERDLRNVEDCHGLEASGHQAVHKP